MGMERVRMRVARLKANAASEVKAAMKRVSGGLR
jgi:hypothetical protein